MNITGAFAAGMAGNPEGMKNANPWGMMNINPLIAHSLYDPASQFIPGTDSGEPHNLHHIDGGYGSFDPARMNNRHNAPPGVRLDDTNVDRSGIPNYKIPVGIAPGASLSVPGVLPPIPENINQSSNLPNALYQMVGNIGNAEKGQFRQQNQGSLPQLPGSGGFEAVMDVFKRRFT